MEIRPIALEMLWPIRQRVMYPDKSLEFVKIPNDDKAKHWAIWKKDLPISIVSVFEENKEWQFRKLATEIEWQGRGYGSKLLTFVIAQAQEAGINKIWCNARLSAFPFYEKLGFIAVGEVWTRNGIEYIKMEKSKL